MGLPQKLDPSKISGYTVYYRYIVGNSEMQRTINTHRWYTDHTFMQCWLPACSCEMIPRTRNERGLSSAGRECWRTKVVQCLIFLKNLTLDSPCPYWSGPVRWLQRAWQPSHLTPADQSRPPSQTHSLHDNNYSRKRRKGSHLSNPAVNAHTNHTKLRCYMYIAIYY